MFHVLTAPGRIPRVRSWLKRWAGLVPLFIAEFIVWIGFGALLPILPVYFSENGVDLALLGVVVAAWPAVKLVAEPIFGWLADGIGSRVPLMVAGLLVSGVAIGLSIVFTGPLPFFVLRALAGLGAAAYDPAARGVVTDATPPGARGEAFGLYGAAQMGGLLFGPAIGGLGAAWFGGLEFVFAFSALGFLVGAIWLGLRVRDPRTGGTAMGPASGTAMGAAGSLTEDEEVPPADATTPFGKPPASLWNRLIIVGLLVNVASWFAGGMYEVVWSLFLTSRGGGLDLVGLTFAAFAVPVLLLSPIAGRWVDRRGPSAFVIGGMAVTCIVMAGYPFMPHVAWAVPMILIEASAFAVTQPAAFAVIAAGSPPGRSSTAQGIVGAFGTLSTIAASVIAGLAADVNLSYPFWIGAGVAALLTVVAVLVDGGRLTRRFASLRAAT